MKRVPVAMTLGFACVCVLALVAIVGFGSSERLAAAAQHAASAQTDQAQQPDMAEMMKRHQQMMADMKTADAKIDELVTAMNATRGEARVTAITQVINELVRQQKAMHEHMGMMDQQMMMRMMGGRGMMRGR